MVSRLLGYVCRHDPPVCGLHRNLECSQDLPQDSGEWPACCIHRVLLTFLWFGIHGYQPRLRTGFWVVRSVLPNYYFLFVDPGLVANMTAVAGTLLILQRILYERWKQGFLLGLELLVRLSSGI